MKLFCKHEWKVLSEITIKSKLEVVVQELVGCSNLPWQLADADRKHIQVFVCDKCGKLKRFVEKI